jgi:hypothetical protein
MKRQLQNDGLQAMTRLTKPDRSMFGQLARCV